MNKEIIIDGVDVSECHFAILPKDSCPAKSRPYARETSCIACKEHNTILNYCKNNPNCYFKQLAHKTQIIDEVEEVIKPYQEQIELDALSLPSAIESILERKTQECDIWKNQVLVLDEESVTVQVTQEQFEEYQKLKQECEKLSILAQEESARNAYIEYELNDKLKQKTQELYFARNEIHSKTEYIQEQRDIIDQLKQECEEQKTIISTLKYIIKYQEDQLYRHHELVLKMASSDDEL